MVRFFDESEEIANVHPTELLEVKRIRRNVEY